MAHGGGVSDWKALKADIRAWGRALGFDAIGIARAELGDSEARLLEWLGRGYHGDMDYMARHGVTRARPSALVPGTVSIISARLNYWPAAAAAPTVLEDPQRAYVSRYALGRDYHKLVRLRLQKLVERIQAHIGGFGHRVFADSAPVMEVEIARRAGLGWRGKHTLLLDREGGSWFFLGEIYTELPLPPDEEQGEHCGTCARCIEVCPTAAIVAPYVLDARRCVSYLTIELRGSIPVALRPLIGNRVYGCDDCQLHCPWNRFARQSESAEFAPRHGLDGAQLAELFEWSEAVFEERLAGSPIRRIGHERWLRNLAVGLGNAPKSEPVVAALRRRLDHGSELVREHVRWALERHGEPA